MNLLTKNGYLRSIQLKVREEKWFQSNFIMSFFSIFVKSYLYYVVFSAVFLNSTKVNSDQITLYYIIVSIVSLSISAAQSVSYYLMEDINSGAIIPYLMRPNSYIVTNFLNNLALVTIRFLFNLILIFGASYLLGNRINLYSLFSGSVSVLLGFTILYFIQAIIGCFSVWFHDITRFRDVVYSLLMLFGGRLIPSDLLFSGLKEIVYYTPLPYVYDVPVKVLMGNAHSSMFFSQMAWVLLLGSMYIFLFQRHVKHNIEFGG